MRNPRQFTHHHFTLVELLVVIAILTVLLSLLTPGLKKFYRKASEVSCVNNLKNLGAGIFLYTDDFAYLYPDRSLPTESTGHETYKGRSYPNADGGYALITYRSHGTIVSRDIYSPLVSYYGGRESMAETFLCPLSKNELVSSATEKTFPYRKYRRNGSRKIDYWPGAIGTYQLYFSAMSRFWMDIPMIRTGDRWLLDVKGNTKGDEVWCNIIASDRMRTKQFSHPNGSHPSPYGPSSWDAEKAGWMFDNSLWTSASYLSDDGSVLFVEGINKKQAPHMEASNNMVIVPLSSLSK